MGAVAFTPHSSVEILVTAGGQANIPVPGYGRFLRLVNNGAAQMHVRFYEALDTPPVVTVGTGMLLPSGAIEVFSVPSDSTRVAALNDGTADGVINVTRGEGV